MFYPLHIIIYLYEPQDINFILFLCNINCIKAFIEKTSVEWGVKGGFSSQLYQMFGLSPRVK